MRKKLQKILAVVLAISMTMSLMTSTAFAASFIDGDESKSYETGKLDDAFRDATSSVTLTSDETVSVSISIGSGKDIDLDLNGNDIQKGGNDEVFEVKNGGKLTIDDSSADNSGTITGTASGSTSVISVTDGGTLNLEGGTITGNKTSGDGGAVYSSNSTVNVSDNAVISNNKASEGGGIYAENNSKVNISGGTITGNKGTSDWMDYKIGRPDGGGGVALVGNGKLTMSGGTISYNESAGAGGGIGIRSNHDGSGKPTFEMTGGSIIGNTAQKHEGGGIRLEGTGSITPSGENIYITNNTCNSSEDLGGGGIFLVNSNSLDIKNAVITGNTAGGLGGGVAGCIHGEIANLSPDGAAIYGNTAEGKNYVTNSFPMNGQTCYADKREVLEGNVNAADGQDFFCAGDSVVGDIMPGGGSAHWSGVSDGNRVVVGVGSAASSDEYMLLTANPTAADTAKIDTVTGGMVMITGNHAKNHGGGIATNGNLTFGSTAKSYNEVDGAKVSANKTVIKVNAETKKEWATNESPAGYTFELLDVDNNVVCTAVSDAKGQVHFDIPASAFNGEGTYTFTMVEKAGSDTNVTYDRNYYKVEVTVTRDKGTDKSVGNNKITAYSYDVTKIVIKDSKDTALTGGETASFTNKINYTPGDTEYVISGTKVVEKAGQYAPNSTFKFDLVDAEDNVLQTQTVTGSGDFTFNALDYTAAQEGTYTYTVVEQELSEEGWTCDKTIYTIVVTVEEVAQGQLQATAEIKKNDETATNIVFTNKYTPAPTGVELTGIKNVNKNSPKNATFKFDLKDAAGNVLETEILTAEEMIEHSGTFKFESLSNVYEVSEVGTHTYTVVEQVLDEKGWTYDETIYTVTVVVTETVDGKLVATTSITKNGEATTDIVFSNTFTPEPTGVELTGTKNVNRIPYKNSTFKFDLKDAEGNVLETEVLTTDEMVEHSGTFKFEALSNAYATSEVGTHTYTVVEQVLDERGWTYDETVYTVTVVVEETGDGRLVATTSITKDGEATTDIVFTNVYRRDTPNDPTTSVRVPVTKVVKNSEAPDAKFEFVLMDETGKVLQTKTLNHAGTVNFSAISYDKDDVGTHVYKVAEVARGEDGWTYDDTVYTVTVKITRVGDILKQEVVITNDDGKTCSSIVFENDYETKGEDPTDPETSVTIPVKKSVANPDAPASAFEFVLMDENGAVLQTLPLNGAGSVAFDSIAYDVDDVGVHTYKVAEVNRGELGWTYDDTVYTVTVTVTSDGKTMDKTVVITNEAGEVCTDISFTNDYNETILNENETPLDSLGEGEMPLAEAPDTGDAFVVWAVLSAVSGAGLVGLNISGKKREEENA